MGEIQNRPFHFSFNSSLKVGFQGSRITSDVRELDTVFVCRMTGETAQKWLFETADELTRIVAHDLEQLRAAGVKPTSGDVRCITYGHATRMAIWNLRPTWDTSKSTAQKLEQFGKALAVYGNLAPIIEAARTMSTSNSRPGPLFAARNAKERSRDAVAF